MQRLCIVFSCFLETMRAEAYSLYFVWTTEKTLLFSKKIRATFLLACIRGGRRMVENDIKSVLNWLNDNKFLHVDMIESLRWNKTKLVYDDSNYLLIWDEISQSYLLTCRKIENSLPKKLVACMDNPKQIVCHQFKLAEQLKAIYSLEIEHDCFHAVYTKKNSSSSNRLFEWKPLTLEKLPEVAENYHDMDEEYLKQRIEAKKMYGAYVDKHLAGFVGMHTEGTIGLLVTLPDYRRRGVGQFLLECMTKEMLNQGRIPFSQIDRTNEASLNLHKKIGFQISQQSVYWLTDFMNSGSK